MVRHRLLHAPARWRYRKPQPNAPTRLLARSLHLFIARYLRQPPQPPYQPTDDTTIDSHPHSTRLPSSLAPTNTALRQKKVVNTGDGSPDGGGLTVSVNTNWFNGFNLKRVFDFLRSELSAVRAALDHLRDSMCTEEGPGRGALCGERREWERQCELVMRANSALNLTEFSRIVVARAQELLKDVLVSEDSADPGAGDGAGAASGEEGTRPPLSASAMPTPGGVGVGHVEVAAASSSRNHGGNGGGGDRSSGAWREERWTTAALEQVGAVLRELSVAPCADHIFLADDDDDRGCDSKNTNSEFGLAAADDSQVEGDAVASGGSSLLRETLESVEAYLLDRRCFCSQQLK